MAIDQGTKKFPELLESSDDRVLLTPENMDKFVRSQREIVQACLQQESLITSAKQLEDVVNDAFSTIREWCLQHTDVKRCDLFPRTDDILVVITAKGDDELGALHDSMADLEADLIDKRNLRLRFMLFRSSEESGIESFGQAEMGIRLYSGDG